MKVVQAAAAVTAVAVAAWLILPTDGRQDHLLITEAVAAPLDAGGAAAFMRIENRGAPDRLVGVASPIIEATLHSPEAPDGPPVPVGGSLLAADGAHVRLATEGASFADGTLIPLTLTFAEAGEVAAKLRLVVPGDGGQAGRADMDHGGMTGMGGMQGAAAAAGEPAPHLALSARPEGDGWRIRVELDGFTLSEEMVDRHHVPGMGHGHLYVGGMKLGRLYRPEAYIGALPKGQHQVRVTLNTNDHRVYRVDGAAVSATTTIVVD